MTRLVAFGIAVAVPARWEGRAFRHEGGEATIHLASFPLPPSDGEFGTRATGAMPDDGLFLVLTEYELSAAEVGRGIFSGSQPRSVREEMLSPRTLLRPLPGQRGLQRFFSAAGRGFCLYVVSGRAGHRRLAAANEVLASLVVESG